MRGGTKRRFVGIGGGGISWESVRTLGSKLGGAVEEGCGFARCALFKLGKAGGESSSSRSRSVSVSEPSSSCSSGCGECRVRVGTEGLAGCVTAVGSAWRILVDLEASQSRKYDVMMMKGDVWW